MSGNPFVTPGVKPMPMQRQMLQNIISQNPQLANAFRMIQNGGNPQQIMQNIMMNNPQAQNVINQMRSSGVSPEQYVRSLAQQYNVDIEPVLNSFRNRRR